MNADVANFMVAVFTLDTMPLDEPMDIGPFKLALPGSKVSVPDQTDDEPQD